MNTYRRTTCPLCDGYRRIENRYCPCCTPDMIHPEAMKVAEAPVPYNPTRREAFGVMDATTPYIPAPETARPNPTRYDRKPFPVQTIDSTDIDGTLVPFVWIGGGKNRAMVFGRITNGGAHTLKEFGKPTKSGAKKYLALYSCPACGGLKEDIDAGDHFDDLTPASEHQPDEIPGQHRTRELTTGYDLVEHGGVCAACYAESFQERHPVAMPGDAEREENEPLPVWLPTLTTCLDCARANRPKVQGTCLLQPVNATRAACQYAIPHAYRTRGVQHFPQVAEAPATYEALTEETVNRFWDVRVILPDADELPEETDNEIIEDAFEEKGWKIGRK
jgi:hypothetical protein